MADLDFSSFNGLDISLVIVMAYFFLRGIFRGAVKEVVAVLGIFFAAWVARIYWAEVAQHLMPITEHAGYRAIISFLTIFMVIYFLIGLLSIFIDKVIKLSMGSFISSLIGAVLGVCKGAIICAILLLTAGVFFKPSSNFFTESTLWKHAQPFTLRVKEWAPKDLTKLLDNNLEDVLNGVEKVIKNENKEFALTVEDIVKIFKEKPELIKPAWQERLQNLTGNPLSAEEVVSFTIAHKELVQRLMDLHLIGNADSVGKLLTEAGAGEAKTPSAVATEPQVAPSGSIIISE